MNREKYLANIDKVLVKSVAKASKSLKDKNAIKYSKSLEDSGQIKKFAFDVYKVDNDPYHDLWLLEDVDGVPHLVRANTPSFDISKSNDWSVASDSQRKNVTLSYKDRPITRFSSEKLGFSSDDVITFKEALLEKITEDGEFIREIFASEPKDKVTSLVNTFPELKKYI